MSSATGRRRAVDRHYSAEEQALDQISKEAEARIAARRAARAEAREIRLKEIERQQKEEEERLKAQEAADSGVKSVSSYSSSRRGSDDSTDSTETSSISLKDPKDTIRQYKNQLREMEEKYRQAMVTNAQLDNVKHTLVYQVELLKDQMEEQEESLLEVQRQYKDRCKQLEMKKRDFSNLEFEHKGLKEQSALKDKLLKESGFVIVSSEEGELTLEKCSDMTNSPTLTLGQALISSEAADLLNKAGEGSLGREERKGPKVAPGPGSQHGTSKGDIVTGVGSDSSCVNSKVEKPENVTTDRQGQVKSEDWKDGGGDVNKEEIKKSNEVEDGDREVDEKENEITKKLEDGVGEIEENLDKIEDNESVTAFEVTSRDISDNIERKEYLAEKDLQDSKPDELDANMAEIHQTPAGDTSGKDTIGGGGEITMGDGGKNTETKSNEQLNISMKVSDNGVGGDASIFVYEGEDSEKLVESDKIVDTERGGVEGNQELSMEKPEVVDKESEGNQELEEKMKRGSTADMSDESFEECSEEFDGVEVKEGGEAAKEEVKDVQVGVVDKGRDEREEVVLSEKNESLEEKSLNIDAKRTDETEGELKVDKEEDESRDDQDDKVVVAEDEGSGEPDTNEVVSSKTLTEDKTADVLNDTNKTDAVEKDLESAEDAMDGNILKAEATEGKPESEEVDTGEEASLQTEVRASEEDVQVEGVGKTGVDAGEPEFTGQCSQSDYESGEEFHDAVSEVEVGQNEGKETTEVGDKEGGAKEEKPSETKDELEKQFESEKTEICVDVTTSQTVEEKSNELAGTNEVEDDGTDVDNPTQDINMLAKTQLEIDSEDKREITGIVDEGTDVDNPSGVSRLAEPAVKQEGQVEGLKCEDHLGIESEEKGKESDVDKRDTLQEPNLNTQEEDVSEKVEHEPDLTALPEVDSGKVAEDQISDLGSKDLQEDIQQEENNNNEEEAISDKNQTEQEPFSPVQREVESELGKEVADVKLNGPEEDSGGLLIGDVATSIVKKVIETAVDIVKHDEHILDLEEKDSEDMKQEKIDNNEEAISDNNNKIDQETTSGLTGKEIAAIDLQFNGVKTEEDVMSGEQVSVVAGVIDYGKYEVDDELREQVVVEEEDKSKSDNSVAVPVPEEGVSEQSLLPEVHETADKQEAEPNSLELDKTELQQSELEGKSTTADAESMPDGTVNLEMELEQGKDSVEDYNKQKLMEAEKAESSEDENQTEQKSRLSDDEVFESEQPVNQDGGHLVGKVDAADVDITEKSEPEVSEEIKTGKPEEHDSDEIKASKLEEHDSDESGNEDQQYELDDISDILAESDDRSESELDKDLADVKLAGLDDSGVLSIEDIAASVVKEIIEAALNIVEPKSQKLDVDVRNDVEGGHDEGLDGKSASVEGLQVPKSDSGISVDVDGISRDSSKAWSEASLPTSEEQSEDYNASWIADPWVSKSETVSVASSEDGARAGAGAGARAVTTETNTEPTSPSGKTEPAFSTPTVSKGKMSSKKKSKKGQKGESATKEKGKKGSAGEEAGAEVRGHDGKEAKGKDDKLKKFMEERKQLQEEIKSLHEQLDEERSKREHPSPKVPQMNGPEMQLYEVQREASKQIHEYKLKLQKAEQEIANLEGTVYRLETQVKRYKYDTEEAEKLEDELKTDRRRLQRELRECQTQVEELTNKNKHLEKRLEKIKQTRAALGLN